MVEVKDQFLIKIIYFSTNERSFFGNRSVMMQEVGPRKCEAGFLKDRVAPWLA